MSRGAVNAAAPVIVLNSGVGTVMTVCDLEPSGYLKLPPGQTQVPGEVWDKVKGHIDMDLLKLQTFQAA